MRTDRRLLIVAVLTATFIGAASASIAQAATIVPPICDQEFSATPLATSSWGATTPWNTQYTTGEFEWYDPANLSFVNGGLRITTEKRSVSGYNYASGIISSGSRVDYGGLSRRAFTYGYFEMRAKLPKGQGVWPAFWLTNDHSYEIDVFELLGNDPNTVYMTHHSTINDVHVQEGTHFTGPDFSAGYHTFAVDWQPSYIRWYVDGVKRAEYTHNVPTDPLWIVANTAVGAAGSWPGAPDATTVFPQYYDIDHIRVYRTMADAAPATTTTTEPTTTTTTEAPTTSLTISGPSTVTAGRTLWLTGTVAPADSYIQITRYRRNSAGGWDDYGRYNVTAGSDGTWSANVSTTRAGSWQFTARGAGLATTKYVTANATSLTISGPRIVTAGRTFWLTGRVAPADSRIQITRYRRNSVGRWVDCGRYNLTAGSDGTWSANVSTTRAGSWAFTIRGAGRQAIKYVIAR